MKVLVATAHPDDEALGMGGTTARLKSEGHAVEILLLGKGRGDELDNRFDVKPLLYWVKIIEKKITEYKPDVIYTHYEHDLNIDHRITYQAVLTAARPLPDSPVKEIYSFEVLSSTEWSTKTFEPDVFIDIKNYIDRKIEMLDKYEPEMRCFPHPRCYQGVRILAARRGMQCGLNCAEAFKTIRVIK